MDNDAKARVFWEMVGLARDDRPRFLARLEEMDADGLAILYRDYERTVANLKDDPFIGPMGYPSEDGADDIAYGIVARGRQAYDDVMAAPERLPAILERDRPDRAFDARSAISRVYRTRFGESVVDGVERIGWEDPDNEP